MSTLGHPKSCPLCGSHTLILEIVSHNGLILPNNINVYKCISCGYMFIDTSQNIDNNLQSILKEIQKDIQKHNEKNSN